MTSRRLTSARLLEWWCCTVFHGVTLLRACSGRMHWHHPALSDFSASSPHRSDHTAAASAAACQTHYTGELIYSLYQILFLFLLSGSLFFMFLPSSFFFFMSLSINIDIISLFHEMYFEIVFISVLYNCFFPHTMERQSSMYEGLQWALLYIRCMRRWVW